jgi:hypothetical protein
MKRHLFYTFLWIFGITSIITLLGVIGVIKISDGYLSALVSAFLIESAGAVVAIFKRADFFSDDTSRNENAVNTSPFRVSDDYIFVPENGFWIEKKTGLRVCANCLLPPTKIVSPLVEGLGSDFEGNPCLVWRCGNCRSEFWHESQKTSS